MLVVNAKLQRKRSAEDQDCFTTQRTQRRKAMEAKVRSYTPKAGPRLSRHNGQVDFSPDRSKVPMQQIP